MPKVWAGRQPTDLTKRVPPFCFPSPPAVNGSLSFALPSLNAPFQTSSSVRLIMTAIYSGPSRHLTPFTGQPVSADWAVVVVGCYTRFSLFIQGSQIRNSHGSPFP